MSACVSLPAMPPPDLGPGRGRRLHPSPKVGQRFGQRTVLELVPAFGMRADVRVRWRCTCGRTGIGFIWNLRKSDHCRHHHIRVAVDPSTPCETPGCKETYGDHILGGGECLEDDCECQAYEGPGHRRLGRKMRSS